MGLTGTQSRNNRVVEDSLAATFTRRPLIVGADYHVYCPSLMGNIRFGGTARKWPSSIDNTIFCNDAKKYPVKFSKKTECQNCLTVRFAGGEPANRSGRGGIGPAVTRN